MKRGLGFTLAGMMLIGAVRAQAPAPSPSPCESHYVLPIAPWAQPTKTPAYSGDYVGGSCLWGGPRDATDGTWGYDYEGSWFKRWVFLDWCHCRSWQGDPGTYKTDGPKLIEH